MLKWMQTMIDEVPAEFQPRLSPLQPGETVLGALPSDAEKWFRASVWARNEAERVLDEHTEWHRHHDGREELLESFDDIRETGCIKAYLRSERLKNCAAILGSAVLEALREHFELATDAHVEVRREGVAMKPEDNSLELFAKMLGGDVELLGF